MILKMLLQTMKSKEIIKEMIIRLQFLSNVGLEYLSLKRNAQTLSGGESQRIRLAAQIGLQLVGVLYILDDLNDYNETLFQFSGDLNSDEVIDILDIMELVSMVLNNN